MKATKNRAVLWCASILVMTIIFTACETHIPFEKDKWNEQTDPAFPSPYRVQMLKDLLEHHKLVGMKCSEIRDTLGKPDGKDSNYYSYMIDEQYGRGIDPVYVKNLVINFSKDSVVTKVATDEWDGK